MASPALPILRSIPIAPVQPVPGANAEPEADGLLGFQAIERLLAEFESSERKKLGLPEKAVEQWVDAPARAFTKSQKERTTLLVGGLTMAHDYLVAGAFSGLGYTLEHLEVPDNDALRIGKEFGNRGQCNPTYFTVGNLVKHLMHLRDDRGMSAEDIVDKYVFLTAGACGPCRFGTYVTEYRKALRDAGFDGFRVLLFQPSGGVKQATGEGCGLELNPTFFWALFKAILAGDILNLVGYRLRPYERTVGATDRAIEECKAVLHRALENRTNLVWALMTCRRILGRVEVDRLRVKPKVSIIGEFWAMTTEGDGNYRLQRFLESEGAEVDIQPIVGYILYSIWQHRFDTKRRLVLRGADTGKKGLAGKDGVKKLRLLWAGERLVRGIFSAYSRAIGLKGYQLPDLDEVATIAHQHYDIHLRGGEGHLEVGKLMQSVRKQKAHMVVSVKPFGCMPSSGVSDGVQSLITARYPEAIFTAIETTGDGAVNVQSRVQMDLFKARQKAEKEFADVLAARGLDRSAAERLARRRRVERRPLAYPRHVVAGTAANQVAALARG